MIGKKLYKKDLENEAYEAAAKWANENGAYIEDNGEYFEVCSIPGPSFDELKEEKKAELNAYKRSFDNQLLNEKMVITSSLGFRINADLRSQNNIRGLLEAGANNVEFRDAENKGHAVTAEDLKTLLVECIQNGEYLYAQAWLYEHDIEQAKTAEDLKEIKLVFSMLDFSENID